MASKPLIDVSIKPQDGREDLIQFLSSLWCRHNFNYSIGGYSSYDWLYLRLETSDLALMSGFVRDFKSLSPDNSFPQVDVSLVRFKAKPRERSLGCFPANPQNFRPRRDEWELRRLAFGGFRRVLQRFGRSGELGVKLRRSLVELHIDRDQGRGRKCLTGEDLR
ncbi:hypothetical protein ACLB2K_035442 [Fragaria x ananassa]